MSTAISILPTKNRAAALLFCISSERIYYVLRRHGWRKIMPRSKHPKKAKQEAIEASNKLGQYRIITVCGLRSKIFLDGLTEQDSSKACAANCAVLPKFQGNSKNSLKWVANYLCVIQSFALRKFIWTTVLSGVMINMALILKERLGEIVMKRILSFILTVSLAVGAVYLSACSNKQEEKSETQSATETQSVTETQAVTELKAESGPHTLYFKDSGKTDKAVITFFNSVSGKSKDVEMKKISADSDSTTFSCEEDPTVYNMAYVTCGGEKTDSVAFNRCVSGWYKYGNLMLPYTEGEPLDYVPDFKDVTLNGYGYNKVIHIWTPDDYDASSAEKYSTIYVLDGENMVIGEGADPLAVSSGITEQVRSLTAETGYKAIVVTIESIRLAARDYEMVPIIGVQSDEKVNKIAQEIGLMIDYSGKNSYGFDCMSGLEFADFVANTVVPYVQEHYNVYTDSLHTAIQGASLGGLEAFYIAANYADKFGTLGAMSPSFYAFDDASWRSWLGKLNFEKNAPFFYFYVGPDFPGDCDPYVTEMYNRLKDMGYPEDKLALHSDKDGAHDALIWRSVFSEFLEALALRHVDVLQQ